MAYTTTGSKYISSQSPISNMPITVSAIVYNTNNSLYNGCVLSVGRDSNSRMTLIFVSGYLRNSAYNGSSERVCFVNSPDALNSWAHVCAINTVNIGEVYCNATKGYTSASFEMAAGIASSFYIAAFHFPPASDHFLSGMISEVAVWNVALTDSEVNSLSKKFSPRRIRPQSLVFYAPMVRNLHDIRGGLALTNNNSPTVAAHPRVY